MLSNSMEVCKPVCIEIEKSLNVQYELSYDVSSLSFFLPYFGAHTAVVCRIFICVHVRNVCVCVSL